MKRRKAIKLTTGGVLSSLLMSGLMSGCGPEVVGDGYEQLFLSSDDYGFFKAIGNVLIPETDTPGANSLGLAETIDTIVAKCYDDNAQKSVQSAITELRNAIGADFESKDQDTAIALLEQIDSSDSPAKGALERIKSLYGTAYQNTEYVGTNLLVYIPVPGEYEACIDISETEGRAYTYG